MLSTFELLIISKYFENINDYINLMKTNKTYENLTYLFKFNPIDMPFKNERELQLFIKIFKNVKTIHYYNFINEFPHFLNPFVIHFEFNYLPDLEKYTYGTYKNCVLTEYYKNSLGKNIVTKFSDKRFNLNGCKNLDFSQYTKLIEINETFAYKNIESIILPKSIIKINNNAFKCCNQLTKIDLSICTNLTKIGKLAFNYCENLQNIMLPTSIKEIGKDCFKHCYKLK